MNSSVSNSIEHPATMKKEREIILRIFLEKNKVQFKDIEKVLDIRSNLVSYHIDKLLKEGLLTKKGIYYYLSRDAEKYLPIMSNVGAQEVGPITVVLIAIVSKKKSEKILLIKRNRRPYQDYWSMVGGKIKHDEFIESATRRLVKNKTGLDSKFISTNAVFHERVTNKDMTKHSFVLFFVKVVVNNNTFKNTEHGELKWFDVDEIKKMNKSEIIPSDLWLLKKKLNSKTKVHSAIMEEDEGKLTSFELVR